MIGSVLPGPWLFVVRIIDFCRRQTVKIVIRLFVLSLGIGHIEGWAQDYGNSNIFLKPLFRGNLDPFVNNANLGAIAHTSNGT